MDPTLSVVPVIFILGFVLGTIALVYAATAMYSRYKRARWEASCATMEAQAPTEDEKAIGDEWKEALCNPIQVDKIPEGVKVEFSTEYSPDDEAFFKQAQDRAAQAKKEIEDAKAANRAMVGFQPPRRPDGSVDHDAIPDYKDFIDEDGLRYFWASMPGGRKKRRSYRSFIDGERKPMPDFANLERITSDGAAKNTAWVGPHLPGPTAEIIPRMVQQILNNRGDLLQFYQQLPIKELALHIHEANVAGRERMFKIKEQLEADEAAIRREAEARIKALKVKDYEELDKRYDYRVEAKGVIDGEHSPDSSEELVLTIHEAHPPSTYEEVLAKVEKKLKKAKPRKRKGRRK